MSTLADVAKRAGVSLSTASYVLSGKRPISDATRQRVLAAMDELGFHPNNQGRALASGRTRTIALLYPSTEAMLSPVPMEFVTAAAARAEQRGYALVFSPAEPSADHLLSLLRRGFVDGYVVMEVAMDDSRIDVLTRESVPFAMIGRRSNNDGVDYVDLDFEHFVKIATDHLLELGHRSIAMFCRDYVEYPGYGPTERMRMAFNRIVEQSGIEGRIYTCGENPTDGADTFERLLEEAPATTALIVSNFEAITGVIRVARERQIDIPGQLSLVGLISPRIADFFRPAITAVDFPDKEMGRIGVDFLINQLEGGITDPQQLVLRSTVTVRSSTGPATSQVAR